MERDDPQHQFSYDTILDAIYSALWGGTFAMWAFALGPLEAIVYHVLRTIREKEERRRRKKKNSTNK